MTVTSDNNTIIAVGETFNRSDWETIPESAIAGEQSFLNIISKHWMPQFN